MTRGTDPAAQRALRPAAFLDRDGTIIEDTNYVASPTEVRLLPGSADAIRRLNDAGIAAVVVTNQSGIARGYFDFAGYERVRDRLDALLRAAGARIDATYICPHHPDITGPCPCRKPGLMLFEQAAAEHGLDTRRAAFIGDRWHDVAPAGAFGGRGVLIDGPATPAPERNRAARDAVVVTSLSEAVSMLLDTYWMEKVAVRSP